MPYVKSFDRYQMQISSLDMMVDQDSIARIIDVFVESLDLKKLGFKNTSPASEGRPPYSPQALLKLYLYGHCNNIRSSRKLEKACHVNIEVRWLMGSLEPDFRTIANFRKDHLPILKDVFYEYRKRFDDLMTGFVSVDGTKIIACNGRDRNFTASKLDDRIKWLKDHIEDYLRQMDQLDSEEELSGTLTTEALDAKLKEARDRLRKYQEYREYMEQNNLSQISLTDIDSRLMKNRNGFTVSHNVQSVVDSETHMIRDFNVTSSPADYGQLAEALQKSKEEQPDKILEATADKGYLSPEDIAHCLEGGIIPHVILPDGEDTCELDISYKACDDLHPESTDPEELAKCMHAGVIPEAYRKVIPKISVSEKEVVVREPSAGTSPSPFKDEEEMRCKAAEGYFVRDPDRNIVICPAGEILRQNTVTKKDRIRYINKLACRKCPYRSKCYQGKKGFKEVEFHKDEFVKPNGRWQKADGQKPEFQRRQVQKEKRTIVSIVFRPDKQKADRRKCLSEHPFGTIKRTLDSGYFLLCGNAKVTGEFALFSTAYNIKRSINLLGFDKVMRRMALITSTVCSIFNVLNRMWRNRQTVLSYSM